MTIRRLLILFATAFVSFVLALSFAAERGAFASAESQRLNIVVIMSDDQDMDSLPVMRHLLSYIGGGWINFTSAFANDAKCCPSRTSFLTGQYSHNHGVTANGRGINLDDGATLPVWLQDAGYHTGLFGKYLIHFPWTLGANYQPPGWDVFNYNHNKVDDQTAQALKFLDEAPAEQPFFLYLAYTAPHHTANPPERYRDIDVYIPPRRPNFNESDVSDKPKWVNSQPVLSPQVIADWDAERANSQRELLAVDDGVLAIMEKLQEMDALDNTVVIYLADQGFSWGSHRWMYKNCPYVECSNFPLFVRMPGGGPNRVETRLVSNVDVAPTIIELAGAEISGRAVDGRSFAPLLRDPSAVWGEGVLMERHQGQSYYRFYAAQSPEYMYSEFMNGDVELYDMAADPYQMNNVAGDPAYAAAQAQMKALLERLRAGEDPPLPTPTPTATATEVAPTATATLEPTATVTGTPPTAAPVTVTPVTATPTTTTPEAPTPTATRPHGPLTEFSYMPVLVGE